MHQNPAMTILSRGPILFIEKFHPEHLNGLDVQGHQISATEMVQEGEAEWLAKAGPAYTVRRPDGSMVAALGIVHLWDGRGMGWALLGADIRDVMLPLTRAVSAWLRLQNPYRRTEAFIDPTFPQGVRWAELLGFVRETPLPMPRFYPNGNSAYMYARIQEVHNG